MVRTFPHLRAIAHGVAELLALALFLSTLLLLARIAF